MHRLILLFLLLFIFPNAYSQNAKTSYWQKKLENHLLLKNIHSPIAFTDSGIVVTDTLGQIETFLSFQQISLIESHLRSNPTDTGWYKGNLRSRKIITVPHPPEITSLPLKGWKIAIDPGHVSGNRTEAELEKKYVDIIRNGKTITLVEGRLNLVTAFLLQDSLEKLGATVMLTRVAAGSSDGHSFKEWKVKEMDKDVRFWLKRGKISAEQADRILTATNERDQFLFFNNIDLERRAEKINAFKPDLALMLHYNVDVENEPWTKATRKDLSMVFVPGAFGINELNRREDRFELVRLLLSDVWEKSVIFSVQVQNCFENRLDVPPAEFEKVSYLKNYSRDSGNSGVFSRNLSLTRLVKFPMVYGEPLYQDNYEELIALSRTDGWIRTETWNYRLKQVADCYISGILNYSGMYPKH